MALVLAPEPPLPDWLAALDAQIDRSPSFFDNRPVVLDLAALPREQPDIAGLFARTGAARHPHHRQRGRASVLDGHPGLGPPAADRRPARRARSNRHRNHRHVRRAPARRQRRLRRPMPGRC